MAQEIYKQCHKLEGVLTWDLGVLLTYIQPIKLNEQYVKLGECLPQLDHILSRSTTEYQKMDYKFLCYWTSKSKNSEEDLTGRRQIYKSSEKKVADGIDASEGCVKKHLRTILQSRFVLKIHRYPTRRSRL